MRVDDERASHWANVIEDGNFLSAPGGWREVIADLLSDRDEAKAAIAKLTKESDHMKAALEDIERHTDQQSIAAIARRGLNKQPKGSE